MCWKKINIKSIEDGIQVFLNEKALISIKCQIKNNLSEKRNVIKQIIKECFTSLDTDKNEVYIKDERDFEIKDILNNDKIMIKSESISDFPPANIVPIETIPKPFKKKDFDFSKFKIIKKETNMTFYRYSKVERKEIHKLIYQYNFHKYDYS